MPSPDARPRVAPTFGRTTRALRALSIGATVLGASIALVAWPSLPETVPIHFNAAGVADDHGPRWLVLALIATWVVLVGGVAWLSRHPRAFNYPVEITEENAARVYGEGVRMMAWLMACLTVMFGSLTLMSFGIDASVALGFAFVAMVGGVIVGIVLTVRAARPTDADDLS